MFSNCWLRTRIEFDVQLNVEWLDSFAKLKHTVLLLYKNSCMPLVDDIQIVSQKDTTYQLQLIPTQDSPLKNNKTAMVWPFEIKIDGYTRRFIFSNKHQDIREMLATPGDIRIYA